LRIVAEEIEIKNVGGKGVASEATLKLLQQSMTAMARQLGSTNDQNARAYDAYIKSLNTATTKQKKNSEAIDENTDAVESNTSALGSIAGALGGALMSGITSVAGSMFGLGKELLIGGDNLSDFTRHVPLVGGALTGLVGYFEGLTENFQSLSSQGVAFNNSIIDMRVSAMQAGMGLTDFSTLISQNADRLTFFGGTATEGAKQLGLVSRELRTSNLGRNLQAMGFTVEDLNEGLVNYAQLEARITGQKIRDDQQLIEGSAAYLKQLDQLSKLTGQSRSQQADMMAQQAAEANVAARMAGMDDEQRRRFQGNLNIVNSMLPGFSNAFKDLTDGIPQTELGETLYAMVPEFARLAENAENLSMEELDEGLRRVAPQLSQFRDEMGAAGVTALSDSSGGFAALFSGMYQFQEYMSRNFDPVAAAEEAEKRELVTTALSNMSTTINDIRTRILLKFFEEGGIGTKIQTFLEGIKQEDIDSFNTNLNNFLDSFTEDPGQAVKDLYNDILDVLLGEFSRPDGTGARQGGILAPMFEQISTSFMSGIRSIFEDPELRKTVSDAFANVLRGLNESSWIADMLIPDSATQTDTERQLQSQIDALQVQIREAEYDYGMANSYGYNPSNTLEDIEAMKNQLEQLQSQMPQRRIGTYGATGRLTEPRNTIAQIHAGERVLSPQEAADYNNAASNTATDNTGVTTAITNTQHEVSNSMNRLNSTMQMVVSMLQENNRLTKRTVDAIAEGGNLQG
jgi:hypothetical protein